jgi:hypothetical protein
MIRFIVLLTASDQILLAYITAVQIVGIASDLLDATLKMQTASRSLSFYFRGTLAAQSGNDHATSRALSSLKHPKILAT